MHATAIADEALPAALVDLNALDHNVRELELAATLPLRIASKSVRCTHLLRYLLTASDGFRGIMSMSPRETLFLHEQGFDDLLIAYPVARRADALPLVQLARRGARFCMMVDCRQHVDLLQEIAAAADVHLHLCLDLDVAWRPAPGVHLGARRSPVRTARQALHVAERVATCSHLTLDALMGYEAQIASLPDHGAGPSMVHSVKRRIKAPSMRDVMRRRHDVVRALRDAGHDIVLVNGGGTGSIRATSQDPTVTEVTAGSGFFCPHLFDGFDNLDLRPATFMALPVARRASPSHVTCHGGGFPASGTPGQDRWPQVWSPAGLRVTGMEGWGEVQTPFVETSPGSVQLGSAVIARHAKAGELCERFPELLLVRDGRIVDRVQTYRGQGCAP